MSCLCILTSKVIVILSPFTNFTKKLRKKIKVQLYELLARQSTKLCDF